MTLQRSSDYAGRQLSEELGRFEHFASLRRTATWLAFLGTAGFFLAPSLPDAGASLSAGVGWLLLAGAVSLWGMSKGRTGWWVLAGIFFSWVGLLFLFLARDYGYGLERERLRELQRGKSPPGAVSWGVLLIMFAVLIGLVALAIYRLSQPPISAG